MAIRFRKLREPLQCIVLVVCEDDILYFPLVINLYNASTLPPLLQAVLWSNLFKYELELGHSQGAYAAMMDNPDPIR